MKGSIKIKCLMLVGYMIVAISSLCIAEEYGSNTIFQGTWGRAKPTIREKALGIPPLSASEEIRLGYEPAETETGSDGHCEPASGPRDFDIDKDGNFWIVDLNKKRIVKFSSQGEYILSIDKAPDGMPYFDQPIDIAIDRQGNIYVIDLSSYDECVQKFDSRGNFIEKIREFNNYIFAWITDVNSTFDGNICIMGRVNGKENLHGYIFAPNGNFLGVQDYFKDEQGKLYRCKEKIYRDENGGIVGSLNNASELISKIEILSSDEKLIRMISITFKIEPKGKGDYIFLGIDGMGNLYFYHWYYQKERLKEDVLIYDSNGRLIAIIKIKQSNTIGMVNDGFKILPDGTIYQMHATDEGLSIIKYNPEEP